MRRPQTEPRPRQPTRCALPRPQRPRVLERPANRRPPWPASEIDGPRDDGRPPVARQKGAPRATPGQPSGARCHGEPAAHVSQQQPSAIAAVAVAEGAGWRRPAIRRACSERAHLAAARRRRASSRGPLCAGKAQAQARHRHTPAQVQPAPGPRRARVMSLANFSLHRAAIYLPAAARPAVARPARAAALFPEPPAPGLQRGPGR